MTIRCLWNEVAKAMWDDWENAPTQVRTSFLLKVKTHWRSMKYHFNKDLRQESHVPRGSGARIRKYKYHCVLAFLRPVLAQRITWSSTVGPGSGVVFHQTAMDPSQPSSSAAASGPATQTGDQEDGPSGLPLSQSSASTPFLGGSSRQQQRASDRSLMPEFLHLSSVFHKGLKALGDRMEISLSHMNTRIQEVTKSLDQVKADLQRPAHHFLSKLSRACRNPLLLISSLLSFRPAMLLMCRLCSRVGIFSRQCRHIHLCLHCHS
ncbi:uncharacterized protein [Ranitomeya imitator]|uniref:uncharacterized protein isoform X2 n=1 Tax=Ranitomeya imitator TaxID=111125 RepID=UPI0037E7A76B